MKVDVAWYKPWIGIWKKRCILTTRQMHSCCWFTFQGSPVISPLLHLHTPVQLGSEWEGAGSETPKLKAQITLTVLSVQTLLLFSEAKMPLTAPSQPMTVTTFSHDIVPECSEPVTVLYLWPSWFKTWDDKMLFRNLERARKRVVGRKEKRDRGKVY